MTLDTPRTRRPRRAANHARMEDVARHAGVSVITVSRALGHPDKVSEKTRERVSRAIKEIGYVPNRLAGGLASTRSHVIAAIVPYIRHGVFSDILQGISDVLRQEGYSLLLGDVAKSPDKEELLLTNLLGLRPAGVILHGGNHTPGTRSLLRNARIAVVETGELVADPIDLVVGYSNFEAARAMTAFLYERGYRKIAFVCDDTKNNDRWSERLRGYGTAVRQLGLPDEPGLRIETTVGIRAGAEAMRLFLERAPDIEAVFCASDMWAVGAIFECQRRGLSIPSRIAVAGCDDQPIASQIVPALTTIHLPRYEMGQRAARLLLDRLHDRPLPQTVVELGFEIVSRDSA